VLEPTDRVLLLDALRPPAGMVLEHAVGTTFTLDLEALMMAPVAFALFDAQDGQLESVDPLSLLEAVRRNADRMDIFCQAGQISLPAAYQPVITQLEDSIHPVSVGERHIFHPKVWVMRYGDPNGRATHHRVLVLSRNLTFDKSWDLIVRLEEDPRSQSRLTGLTKLITWLPDHTVQPVDESRRALLTAMATGLESTGFKVPSPFRGPLDFHAFGIGDDDGIHEIGSGAERLLVVAPFATQSALAALTESNPKATIVSRSETLDHMREEALQAFEHCLVLDPTATPDGDTTGTSSELARPHSVTGLHAKLFIAERGSAATWWIGSSNATGAAFGGNVEILLTIEGKRSRVGMNRFLDPDEEGGFRSLLRTYVRSETPEPDDFGELNLETAARRIAAIPLIARIEPGKNEELYSLRLTVDHQANIDPWPKPVFWPITLSRARGVAMPSPQRGTDLDFGEVTLTAITPFFAFELEGAVDGSNETRTFVVRATLIDDPEDRRQRVLTKQLQSKRDVLRYLLLLLTEAGDGAQLSAITEAFGSGTSSGAARRAPSFPLFESMMRSLASNPTALDHVAHLIDDLRSTEEGKRLVPDGLDAVWDPIWEARQRL